MIKIITQCSKVVCFTRNKSCVFCSFLSAFYFIFDKIAADHFKYEIKPSLKLNDMLTLSQDVPFNHVREKGKPQCKISYKLWKEEYG